MIERFTKLPSALEKQSRLLRLGDHRAPALLAHPGWDRPAPVVLWMHGRTAQKTLDPGRYLRWIRAGIAACAVDLPGHGERFDEAMQAPDHTLFVVEQMVREIDSIIEALGDGSFRGAFDLDRVAIGGMSAGGMAALRRACDPHRFRAIAVESTVGDFSVMPYVRSFPHDLIERLDPIRHLDRWRCVPLLALHSEKDEWAPVEGMRRFTENVRERCDAAPQRGDGAEPGNRDDAGPRSQGAPARSTVNFVTWRETGAPNEHAGFGRVANDAKNLQNEFFMRWLIDEV